MPSCPFCTSSGRPWGRVHGLQAHECPGCGVVFFPRPIGESADYQEYYPYLKHFDDERFAWELSVRRRKYRHQLEVIRRHRPGAVRLTDVGAGPGYLCKVAMEEGWQAQGVETAEPAVKAGEERFGVRYVALEDVEAQSQDAITCHHVLEHIEEPDGFLRLLRSKLVGGGVLVVHVPNCEPLTYLARNLLRRNRQRGGDVLCQLYHPEHITGFTTRSLPAAISRFGFTPLSVRCVSMWSRFYDPFFLRNYLRDHGGEGLWRADYRGIARQVVQSLADNAGNAIGRGDWVVGHFRAV